MIFMDVKDRYGVIQVASKLDLLLDKFEIVKLVDIGDIVGACRGTGHAIFAESFQL